MPREASGGRARRAVEAVERRQLVHQQPKPNEEQDCHLHPDVPEWWMESENCAQNCAEFASYMFIAISLMHTIRCPPLSRRCRRQSSEPSSPASPSREEPLQLELQRPLHRAVGSSSSPHSPYRACRRLASSRRESSWTYHEAGRTFVVLAIQSITDTPRQIAARADPREPKAEEEGDDRGEDDHLVEAARVRLQVQVLVRDEAGPPRAQGPAIHAARRKCDAFSVPHWRWK